MVHFSWVEGLGESAIWLVMVAKINHTIDPRHLLKWLFFRPFHLLLVSFTGFKKVITWWQTSLGADGHSLQHSCCKLLKKYQVLSKSYPCDEFCICWTLLWNISWMYLARKYKTQQTCKQTVKQLLQQQRFTHYTIITFVISRACKKKSFQQTYHLVFHSNKGITIMLNL